MIQTTNMGDGLRWRYADIYKNGVATAAQGSAPVPSLGGDVVGSISPKNIPPQWRGRLDETYRPGCSYCSNTGTHVNARGGVECAGCGHPL